MIDNCYSLGTLPDSFGSLSSLRQLQVTHCLTRLPDSFGNLGCLQKAADLGQMHIVIALASQLRQSEQPAAPTHQPLPKHHELASEFWPGDLPSGVGDQTLLEYYKLAR